MTVSDSIIAWLKTHEATVIDTDFLKPDAVSYGLFKNPTESRKEDILGNVTVTAYYTFRVRFTSKVNQTRINNQSYMEELQDWINEATTLPELEHGTCKEISVTTPFFVETTETDTSVYQMTIGIVYRKEN